MNECIKIFQPSLWGTHDPVRPGLLGTGPGEDLLPNQRMYPGTATQTWGLHWQCSENLVTSVQIWGKPGPPSTSQEKAAILAKDPGLALTSPQVPALHLRIFNIFLSTFQLQSSEWHEVGSSFFSKMKAIKTNIIFPWSWMIDLTLDWIKHNE